MQRAALEWTAEEHATQARVDAKVQAMQDAAPPAPVAPPSPEAAKAAQVEAAAAAALPAVASIAWRIADRAIQNFLGPHCAATPEEIAQLSALTVPVITKWLPADMTGFLATPEGALAFAALSIYGLKAMAGAPPDAAPPAPPEVPAAPSPAPEVSA